MNITVSAGETNTPPPPIADQPAKVVVETEQKHDAQKACEKAKCASEKLNHVTRKDHHLKWSKVATLNVGDGRASLNNNSKLTVGATKYLIKTDATFDSMVLPAKMLPGEEWALLSQKYVPDVPSQPYPTWANSHHLGKLASGASSEPVSVPMKHLQLRAYDVNSFNVKDPSYIEVLYPDGTLKKFNLKKGHSIMNLEVPAGYQIHAHSGLTSEKAQKSGDVRDNFRVDIFEGESSQPKQAPKITTNPPPAKALKTERSLLKAHEEARELGEKMQQLIDGKKPAGGVKSPSQAQPPAAPAKSLPIDFKRWS